MLLLPLSTAAFSYCCGILWLMVWKKKNNLSFLEANLTFIGYLKNKCSDRSMEVRLPALLGNSAGRHTVQPSETDS